MTETEDFLSFINEQIKYCELQADIFRSDEGKSGTYVERKEKFLALHSYIQNLEAEEQDDATNTQPRSLMPSDLDGLPPELIEQLSTKTDELETRILSIMEKNGGMVSLDEILIGLYRETSKVPQRTKINAKVYRMVQKKQIEGVKNRKAVYKLI